MWGPLAPHLDSPHPSPATVEALAAAALWGGSVEGPGWPADRPGPLQPQHRLPTVAQALPPQLQPEQVQPQPQHGGQHSAAAKVYIQGLPQGLQHPVAVASLFSPFGDVLDVKLYAAEVRLSGGSAVVRMRTTTQAAAAIAALNGIVPEGGWQQLTVRAAETAEQRSNRITAINGRQGAPGPAGAAGSPHSALQLPPAGPGAALRRVHSARGTGSAGALQAFTGLITDGPAPHGLPSPSALPGRRSSLDCRGSMDWGPAGAGNGGAGSLDGSRRSSMDVARVARSSSDSGGSGSGSVDELPLLAPGEAALPGGGAAADMQRMLLEAVLSLVGQVETGQLSLSAMRVALEGALTASKQAGQMALAGEEAALQNNNNNGGGAVRAVPPPSGFHA